MISEEVRIDVEIAPNPHYGKSYLLEPDATEVRVTFLKIYCIGWFKTKV